MNNLFIDCETTGLNPYKDELIMVGYAVNDGPVYTHEYNRDIDGLLEMLNNKDYLKIGHNINFDLLFLNRNGYRTVGPYFDTQLYHHIQDPYSSSKLKDLGETILKKEVKRIDDIIQSNEEPGLIKIGCGNTKGFGFVKEEILKSYLCQDVELTRGLYRLIEEKGITSYYERIEQPLIQPILDMELRGLKIDLDLLDIIDEEFSKEIKELEKYFDDKNINPRSPKQIREYIKNDSN